MSGALSLEPSYYDALRRLTLELAGVRMGADHAFLVETRLAGLARREGFASLDAMIGELFASGQTRLAVRIVSALVERDTHFNRDPASLDAMFEGAVEPLAAALQSGERASEGSPRAANQMDILCYGCGSGQDVYSIAMRALHWAEGRTAHGLPSPRVSVSGVDYPSQALERARAGRFTHFEVQRGLSAADMLRWFEPGSEAEGGAGSDWTVGAELKALTRFSEMHLLSGLDELSDYDIVTFRGSLAHYSAPAQVRVLRGLTRHLRPGGYLVLGSGEGLGEMRFGLESVPGQPTLYAKPVPPPEPVAPVGKQPNGRTDFGPERRTRRRRAQPGSH